MKETGYGNSIIEYCYNLGDVSGNDNLGGIIGYNGEKSSTNNVGCCYNIGKISSTQNSTNIGGIVGILINGTISNCYYLTGTATGGINGSDVQGQAEVKTAIEMRSSEFVTLLNNGKNNWKIAAVKNEGYPILNWEDGDSIIKVSQIITGFENKTLTLSGSVAIPVYYGNKITLNTTDKYYVEFDYKCLSGTNKFDVDLYPDSLPQILPVANTTIQHGMWIVNSNVSDMQSCQLRFFDDIQEANESDIIITNITMYKIQ